MTTCPLLAPKCTQFDFIKELGCETGSIKPKQQVISSSPSRVFFVDILLVFQLKTFMKLVLFLIAKSM